jgi:predicted DNA-binding protein
MSISNYRQQADAILNTTRQLQSSREISLAITSLQRAFSWMGKTAKATGLQSPYKHGYNHKSPVVEPVADHQADRLLEGWLEIETNNVAKVKYIRNCIKKLVEEFDDFISRALDKVKDKNKYLSAAEQASTSLTDAEIWLGWELIRQADMPQQ